MDDSGWTKTKVGRRVYTRKVHVFTLKDVLRVAKGYLRETLSFIGGAKAAVDLFWGICKLVLKYHPGLQLLQYILALFEALDPKKQPKK